MKHSKLEEKKRKKVLRIESQRKAKGYHPGWTYHRCEEQGLLRAMKRLEKEGKLNRFADAAPSPKKKLQARRPRKKPTSTPPQKKPTKNKLVSSNTPDRSELNFEALSELINGKREVDPGLELLPETCHHQNIRVLLSRADWRFLRQKTLDAAEHKCQMCGDTPDRQNAEDRLLDCHEVWQYDDNTCKQTLIQLMCLCRDCHDVKHIDFQERSSGEITHLPAFLQFMKVTGRSESEALDYYRTEFELAKHRSNFDWKLDVSIIAKIGLRPKQDALERGVDTEKMRKRRQGSKGQKEQSRPRPASTKRNWITLSTPKSEYPSQISGNGSKEDENRGEADRFPVFGAAVLVLIFALGLLRLF